MANNTPNEEALTKCGVKNALHQKILIASIPCGIETINGALQDKTNVTVNAPRALMLCHWEGMVTAFQKLEAESKGK